MPTINNLLRTMFFSPNEPRLRAGWRLLAQLALMAVLGICIAIPGVVVGQFIFEIQEILVAQVIGLFTITLSVFLARRFIDRRTFSSLGLRRNRQALADLLAGLLIATLMVSLLAFIMWSAGWLGPEGFDWNPSTNAVPQVGMWLLIFILTGWNEELLSRGYQLQNLREGLNLPLAVLISSGMFGLAHIFNPHASLIAAINITLAGVFFAFAWWRTQSLWLPIGLHIGWNFVLGVVFGLPVSGIPTYRLAHLVITGPQAWTGGEFGPEAGLIVLPILLFGALLVYGYTHNDVYPIYK